MSKYYSYIFYADRNVRPWMILGYTLATFPKVAIYIFMHNPRRNKDLAQLQEKGTLHNWWRISGHQVFYTARERLNKDKEGRSS